jgi:hypothetical protein
MLRFKVLWIRLRQLSRHTVYVRFRLLPRNARLQVPEGLEQSCRIRPVGQRIPANHFLLHNRKKNIWRNKHDRPAKIRRRYADHREGMLVDAHNPPDDAAVVLEPRVPIPVAQHQIWRTPRSMLVRHCVQAAQVWMYIQNREVIPRSRESSGCFGVVARIDGRAQSKVERRQILKAVVPVAQVQVARIRLKSHIGAILRPIQALRVRHIQRVEHKRIQNSKHYSVRPNRQCQRHDSCKCESLRLAQNPERKLYVLKERLHEMPADGFIAFLFISFASAKLYAGPSFGFCPAHSIAFQIVRPVLNMRAKLLVHVCTHFGALEDSSDANAKRIEDLHISSTRANVRSNWPNRARAPTLRAKEPTDSRAVPAAPASTWQSAPAEPLPEPHRPRRGDRAAWPDTR